MVSCSFKIKVQVLKKAVQLVKSLFSKDLSIVFRVNKAEGVVLRSEFGGAWLEQKLPIIELDPASNGTFMISLDSISKLKFPTKEVVFSLRNDSRKKPWIHLESGSFKSVLSISEMVEPKTSFKAIPLKYTIDCVLLLQGLSLLSFKPITEAGIIKVKAIKLKCYKEGMLLITNDSYRGAVFWIPINVGDLNITADLAPIHIALSSLEVKESVTVELGCTEKQIRIKSDVIDLQFPLRTSDNVGDVDKIIHTQENTKTDPIVCAFNIDAKAFKAAIDTVCCAPGISSTEDIKIHLEICENILKIRTKSVGDDARSVFTLPVECQMGNGVFAVASKVLSSILLIEQVIRIFFYKKVVIFESSDHCLKFILPQLPLNSSQEEK